MIETAGDLRSHLKAKLRTKHVRDNPGLHRFVKELVKDISGMKHQDFRTIDAEAWEEACADARVRVEAQRENYIRQVEKEILSDLRRNMPKELPPFVADDLSWKADIQLMTWKAYGDEAFAAALQPYLDAALKDDDEVLKGLPKIYLRVWKYITQERPKEKVSNERVYPYPRGVFMFPHGHPY